MNTHSRNCNFPIPPRTRSQKSSIEKEDTSRLNISYTTVVYDDTIADEKVDYDTKLSDLRDKLVTAENVISNQNNIITKLQQQLEERDVRILTLDDKINYYLSKSPVILCNQETQTEDVGLISVRVTRDVSVETETIIQIDDYVQTDNHQLVDNCTEMHVKHVDSSIQTSKIQLMEVGIQINMESSIETSPNNVSVGTESVDMDLSATSSVINKVNPIVFNDRPSEKLSPRVNPKILIVGGTLARGLSSILRKSLPQRYRVCSIVKPEGSFENITGDLERLTSEFTKSDFVIMLLSSSIMKVTQEDEQLKHKISTLISKLSNTNLLFSTIAFDYGDTCDNNFIFSINQAIELELFKYENKMCLYLNKILNRFDFIDKVCLLRKQAQTKICSIIRAIINGEYMDDRHNERKKNKKRKARHTSGSASTNKALHSAIPSSDSFIPSREGITLDTEMRKKKVTKNLLRHLLEILK